MAVVTNSCHLSQNIFKILKITTTYTISPNSMLCTDARGEREGEVAKKVIPPWENPWDGWGYFSSAKFTITITKTYSYS